MAESRSGLLSGLKSIFIEEEVSQETESQVAKPYTPVPAAIPGVVATMPATMPVGETPTAEELKAAELKVAAWSGFKTLENLKKFSAIKTKLGSKIADQTALIAASFEMAEVAGVEQKVVVDEAKSAVSKVLLGITEEEVSAQNVLVSLDKAESDTRKNLEQEKLSLESRLLQISTDLSNLSEETNKRKVSTRRQLEITKNVAGLFVEQWSPIGK